MARRTDAEAGRSTSAASTVASFRPGEQASFSSSRGEVLRAQQALRSDMLFAGREAIARRGEGTPAQASSVPPRAPPRQPERAPARAVAAASGDATPDGFNPDEARRIRDRQKSVAGRVQETRLRLFKLLRLERSTV